MIVLYGIVLCYDLKRFSFSLKVPPFFLARPRFFELYVVCLSLEMFIRLFFSPFLFSSNFCYVDPRIVSIVSGVPCTFLCSVQVVVSIRQCNLQCWQIVFLFFFTHIVCQRHILDLRPNGSSLVFFFSDLYFYIIIILFI